MTDRPTIGIIGVGTMLEAVVDQALRDGWPREKFVLTHRRAERRAELAARFGGAVESDNVAAAGRSDVIMLGVRPQEFAGVIGELSPAMRAGQLFISIAAALDVPWLKRHLPPGVAVVRAVPPPTSWIKAGLGFLSCSDDATSAHRELATTLFQPTCEEILWLEDRHVDLATSVGPALTPYTCLIVEQMLKLGLDDGLPPDLGKRVVLEGIAAAGRMIRDSGYTPREIIDMVATREGLTRASLHTMEKRGVPRGVYDGARAMVARSIELRGEPIPADMADFER
jgi:pyrroline-5-carboxylate reductase